MTNSPYKYALIRIKGTAPYIQHNGQLSDPLNSFTKALKKVTGKRAKTEADMLEASRLEFLGGLYADQEGPVITRESLQACIAGGARKSKRGKDVAAGVLVMCDSRLDYDGPRSPDELWGDGDSPFVSRMRAVVSRSAVMRTRPIFDDWSAEVVVRVDSEVVDLELVPESFLVAAGTREGLGDFRPGCPRGGFYGTFEVESWEEIDREDAISRAAERDSKRFKRSAA